MHGYCSSCRTDGDVARYRMAQIGLRFLHPECAARLTAMGMWLVAVPDADPRIADRGLTARRRLGIGRRLALHWRAVA